MMVNGKTNWLLAGYAGIIGHDRIMVRMAKPHYSNQGVKAAKVRNVNIVSEEMLPAASYVGRVSGSKVTKNRIRRGALRLSSVAGGVSFSLVRGR